VLLRKAHKQFILVHSYPKSYIQSPETTGYLYYAIKIHITNNHTKEVTLNTSSTHISLGNHTTELRTTFDSAHTKEVILNTPRTHTSLGKHTTEFRTTFDSAYTSVIQKYKRYRKDYT